MLRTWQRQGAANEAPFALGAKHWWDPTVGITPGTGIAAWEDRIGAVSVAQGIGAEQPLLVTSAVTGRKVARYNGFKNLFVDGIPAALAALFAGDYTVYVDASGGSQQSSTPFSVADTDAASTSSWIRLFRNLNRAQCLYSTTAGSNVVNGDVFATDAYWAAAHWLYMAVSATEVKTNSFTGVEKQFGKTVTVADISRVAIGSRCVGGTTGFAEKYVGDVANVIVFDRDLNASEHALMQNWLAGRW
jgi:hypothetical protein